MKSYVSVNDIEKGASLLREGKIVAFPTETVYGLGADAFNPEAVARIFELKERPSFDPLIVHISEPGDYLRLASEPDERVEELAGKFWPGPLTIILPKNKTVPDIVTSGLQTVGIRMPDNKIALELIKSAGCPVAAPSANKFGRVSPTTAAHVKKYFPDIDFIIDGGKTKVGIESTVIRLTQKGFQILRHGIITRDEIQKILPYDSSSSDKNLPASPGMLESHYSPCIPLVISDPSNIGKAERERAGLLSFTGEDTGHFKTVILLTEKMDLREYAGNLFEALHEMEEKGVDLIVAEPVPEKGIGIAVMDRLKKASWSKKI